MSAPARSETPAQTRFIVRYYDPKKSRRGNGVQSKTFFDEAAAAAFAEGKRLYGKPAVVQAAAETQPSRLATLPPYYEPPTEAELAASDESRRAAGPKTLAPSEERRRISARDEARLAPIAAKTNRTIEELLAEEGK